MTRAPSVWSEEDREEAVRLALDGWSCTRIGEWLGRNSGSVKYILQKSGLIRMSGRRYVVADEELAKARAMYERGASLLTVAYRLGRDERAVRNALVAAGVQIRNSGQRRRAAA